MYSKRAIRSIDMERTRRRSDAARAGRKRQPLDAARIHAVQLVDDGASYSQAARETGLRRPQVVHTMRRVRRERQAAQA